jgi:hypothetical protein
MNEDRESVICSCGKRTIVVLSESRQKYVPRDKSWVFNRPGGWNCGKKGHYQKITQGEKKNEQ